ncbi:MAG: secretin N-terminal domain-containing protein [Bacteroidota bacterium]
MKSNLCRVLVALSLILTTAGGSLAAGDQIAPIGERTAGAKGKPKLLKNPTFITIKMNSADVRTVLEIMAQKAGMNLLFDDSVAGKINLNLRATPLDEALGLVMKMANLTYRRVGSTLMVGTEDAFKKKGFVTDETRALRVNNAKAEDSIKKIQDLLGAQDLKMVADERTNSIFVSGTEEQIARVRGALEAIDVPTPQVMIEVKLIETSSNGVNRLGLTYGFGAGKVGAGFNNSDKDSASSGQPQAGNPATGAGSSITFSALSNFTANMNARLDALIQENSATVLANPRVIAQDAKKATIKLVNKHPIVKTQVTQTGSTQNVEFQEVGQTLNITPRIDAKGFVTLELSPEISARTKDVIVNGNPVPIVDSRSVDTIARVKDGESIIIGGLIRKDETNSVGKIPLLGDLPLIGTLFRYQSKEKNISEIIIIVTPHIQTKLSEESEVQ